MLPVRPLLGVALSAAALAAAGCGSSDGGGSGKARVSASTAAAKPADPAPAPATADAKPTGPRPTRATYVRRADKVCLQARGVSRRANEVVQKAFSAGQSSRAADAIDSYMPLFNQHLQELKTLRQPAGDAHILSGLIKVMDSQVQALADESKALRLQDSAALQQITQAQQQELQFAEELGRQYGFKVCGRAV